MKKLKTFCNKMIRILVAILLMTNPVFSKEKSNLPLCMNTSPDEVLNIIKKVNDHWQNKHPDPGNAFWDNAAYHTGNMEVYKLIKEEKYRKYSENWAHLNQWKGAKSDNKANWKYSYGETDDYVLFGDWQICFQTYIDLYILEGKKDPTKIARAREVMEYQMSTQKNDYWWWADGLYMVMPVMTHLYTVTGNDLYLKKLYEYFDYARNLMYDEEAGLFYRDAKYIYPKHSTPNGKKDFWARGNGWVFAGLAKILAELPENDAYRDVYKEVYLKLAESIVKCQHVEGYWTRSMLDNDYVPGYETSGTAFFTYGLLWGINNNYLKGRVYTEAAVKAWNYLKMTALQPDGTVGYVQPIGERADQHNVNASSSSNFGVGAFLLASSELYRYLTNRSSFTPGSLWFDNRGIHINAHGGGVLYHNNKYYFFGEHKGERSNNAWVGVNCYSSDDLYNWDYEGVALPVVKNDPKSDIIEGSIIERPKVIYNQASGKFVMYFHLELKGKGYEAARVGVAVSDNVTGPYTYLHSYRPCAGKWPVNMTKKQQKSKVNVDNFPEWWTDEWKKAVEDGMFVRRDHKGGQMSRDMTLFVDDDDKAYHIYSSEENLTLHIAELSDDYLSHTGKYVRVAPAGHNEAPAVFKKDGKYFMITSGCTGWEPNAARLFTAESIWGPWNEHPNPCVGIGSDSTFYSQSTYILNVQGKKDAFIFMADRWKPRNPINGRYIWLPILFKDNLPVLKWMDEWDLSVFEDVKPDNKTPEDVSGYRLVWNDEFNYEGKPDPETWSAETGFMRNEEFQWYQLENANCSGGVLVIEGRQEERPNPNYEEGSNDWRKNRKMIEYTSSCIKTANKKDFQYGRFEIRAKIPVATGSWPAIWTLGSSMPWPSCGEIDIMEYYQINNIPHILANTAWGTDKEWHAKWNTVTVPFSDFQKNDPVWEEKFHIWRMDWDEDKIEIYLDDRLLNKTFLKDTQNGEVGNFTNPFRQPHYILLNLAIGGRNGGIPDHNTFPLKYEIDYVRVYQKIK